MKTSVVILIALMTIGCVAHDSHTFADEEVCAFEHELSLIILPSLTFHHKTVREVVQDIEEQTSQRLDKSKSISISAEGVPISQRQTLQEPTFSANSTTNIPAPVVPLRQISVLDTIKIIAEIADLHYQLNPGNREIVLFPEVR